MNNKKEKIRIHIKNNRWAKNSFPNTKVGEDVFTITSEHFDKELKKFPNLTDRIDFFIDWDEDNFESSMINAEVLLAWNLPTLNLKNIAPKLNWIHCFGAGIEHLLPLTWLPENVVLTNNKGVHADKSGEYGLMAVLMLHNHLPKIVSNQQSKNYKSLYSSPISGSKIVIIGTGSLGSSVARLLAPLGPEIIGVNRQGRKVEGCTKVVKINKLDDILPIADILYIALPDTPETNGLLDHRRLNLLKKNCGIVNVGRQSAIDYEVLCKKLKSGELGGAILDVFSPEPITSDSYLWGTPNLIVTPHVSSDDGNSYVSLTLKLFLRNLERYFLKKTLINQVNKELGY